MKRSTILIVAAGAAVALMTASTRADLVYDFETVTGTPPGPDGFSVNQGTETSVAQSTIGATHGANSMLVVSPASGYSLGGVISANVPAALLSATSMTYDLTVDASLTQYDYIYPIWFAHAPDGTDLRLAPDPSFFPDDQDSRGFNFGGQNYTAQTMTNNLAVYQDPEAAQDGNTGDYTIGQILGFDQAYHPGEAVTFFQFTFEHGANPPSNTLSFYVDNVNVPGGIAVANLTFNNTGGTGDGSTWDVGTSQNFNNGSGPAVFNQGNNVTFNDTNNGHYNVTINTVVNPGSTTVNTSGAYVFNGTGGIGGAGGLTVSGTGSLMLNTLNTYTGATTVGSGASLIVNGSIPATTLNANGHVTFGAKATPGTVRNAGTVNLTSGGKISVAAASSAVNRSVLVASALNFAGSTGAWQGLVDLTNNDLIVHGGSLTMIQNQIKQGLGGVAGITSSLVAASSPKTALGYGAISGTFDGQTVSASDVVVKYTLVGDTTLDGSVNFSDLLAVAQHYNGTSTTWSTGDFNYDGTTNFGDLLGLAQNYNKALTLSASQNSQLEAAGGSSFAAAFVQAEAQVSVPEPASLGMFCIGIAGLLGRKRRTHIR